jgi:hypothetical protein
MLNLILLKLGEKENTGVNHSNTHQHTMGGMDGWMDGWGVDREHFSIGFHILHSS